jgi:ribosomal protein S12 methylthiotransferase accessory factor
MEAEFDPTEKRYKKITLNLFLPDEFPEKYNKSIIKTMDLCAVKKHLINPPEFQINANK